MRPGDRPIIRFIGRCVALAFTSSPVQKAESLGQCDRVSRPTGSRKAAWEEAAGSSKKRREVEANRTTASRDPYGKDLAVEVREYFIPDFTKWKDHDDFEAGFARLLRDLKAEESPVAK